MEHDLNEIDGAKAELAACCADLTVEEIEQAVLSSKHGEMVEDPAGFAAFVKSLTG